MGMGTPPVPFLGNNRAIHRALKADDPEALYEVVGSQVNQLLSGGRGNRSLLDYALGRPRCQALLLKEGADPLWPAGDSIARCTLEKYEGADGSAMMSVAYARRFDELLALASATPRVNQKDVGRIDHWNHVLRLALYRGLDQPALEALIASANEREPGFRWEPQEALALMLGSTRVEMAQYLARQCTKIVHSDPHMPGHRVLDAMQWEECIDNVLLQSASEAEGRRDGRLTTSNQAKSLSAVIAMWWDQDAGRKRGAREERLCSWINLAIKNNHAAALAKSLLPLHATAPMTEQDRRHDLLAWFEQAVAETSVKGATCRALWNALPLAVKARVRAAETANKVWNAWARRAAGMSLPFVERQIEVGCFLATQLPPPTQWVPIAPHRHPGQDFVWGLLNHTAPACQWTRVEGASKLLRAWLAHGLELNVSPQSPLRDVLECPASVMNIGSEVKAILQDACLQASLPASVPAPARPRF